jgi:hypothetical protein
MLNMKLKRFNEMKLNDFESDNKDYDVKNFNTIVDKDISNIIETFLSDLEQYNIENNIEMSSDEIKKSVDIFKNDFISSDMFKYHNLYDEQEYFDVIGSLDSYFEYISNSVKKN